MSDSIVYESTLKTIKAINERLAVYERQGLTDSAYYQKMIERIRLEGLPTTTSKTGTIRLSRAKADISNMDLSALSRVSKMPSLKEERQRVKAKGYKTRKDQDERINQYGRLQKWFEEHLDELYEELQAGLVQADTLYKEIKNGLRDNEYDEIFNMIDEFEKARARTNAIFQDSKYAVKPDEVFPKGGDYFDGGGI